MSRLVLCLWLICLSAPAFAWIDSDNDGVPDKKDACADSPKDAIVQANGCHQETLWVPQTDTSATEAVDMQQTVVKSCFLDEASVFNFNECDNITITPVYFEFAKSQVLQTQKPLLQKIAMIAQQYQGQLTLVGHTDIIGSEAFNQDLSLKRAKNVAQVLVTEYGLMATDINYYGMASSVPADDNNTVNGRQANRRVEMTINK